VAEPKFRWPKLAAVLTLVGTRLPGPQRSNPI
jgi:hypothetical protein